jgi:hypothetical protein
LKGHVKGPSRGLETPFEGGTKDRHRAAHLPGFPGRIESDPELRAFILQRIETQTLAAIIAAVRATFPPGRQTSLSGLSRWWKRHGRAAQSPHR